MDVKATIRRHSFAAMEGLWRRGLRLGTPLLFDSAAPSRWRPGGRALVVAPHPDDETLGAGGAIALHRQHGDPVTVVVITDGRGSHGGALAPDEMARRRAAEVSAAAQVLGVSELICLELPEGSWTEAQARSMLVPLLSNADVVYAPSCVDFHPDHLRAARLLAGLLRPGQTMRVYELSVPLSPLLANLVLDAGRVAAQKQRALACFATQAAALVPLARLARYRSALYGHAAEVFWEMSAPAYRRVMAYGTWDWQESPFRGIRPRPFSDPLAFLIGRSTRRRLHILGQTEDNFGTALAGS